MKKAETRQALWELLVNHENDNKLLDDRTVMEIATFTKEQDRKYSKVLLKFLSSEYWINDLTSKKSNWFFYKINEFLFPYVIKEHNVDYEKLINKLSKYQNKSYKSEKNGFYYNSVTKELLKTLMKLKIVCIKRTYIDEKYLIVF